MILKLIWNAKALERSKTIFKKNKVVRLPPPDFQAYKATIIKTVWY